jgi:hypothetical protein
MSTITRLIHFLNVLIGCICIVVLGLTANAVALKDELENTLPSGVEKIGMTFLFWPGCGGLVDTVLFIVLWTLTPWEQGSVCRSDNSELRSFPNDV